MQLVGSLCKRHAVASRLRPLVNERFQVLFHSPPGVLPTFPSRYWSTIGLPGIFSLAAWSPQIQTGFLVSRPTQVASASQPHGLGSSPFARHYSGNRFFFLLLQVLRCFSSLRTPRSRDLSTAFSRAGSPIRTPPDHFLFADPRGFSQLTTSFFASGSLGIPRSLFSSFSYSLGESYALLRSPSLSEGQPASAHALCLLKL